MTLSQRIRACRQSKNCRLSIIGILILVVISLLVFGGKAKIGLGIILIVLLSAFGIEYFNYDIDLGKLWETGSTAESRVEHKSGMKIFGTECASNNLNCSDFQTQEEAQEKYAHCADKIASDNDTTSDNIKNIDIYGLDRDKDGLVCESLKK